MMQRFSFRRGPLFRSIRLRIRCITLAVANSLEQIHSDRRVVCQTDQSKRILAPN